MVKESIMICLDNSEYMRNGDFYPTRHDAQVDAVHMITAAKLNGNPETEVGLLSMAGRSPTVVVTPTRDDGKVLARLHGVEIDGDCDFISAARIASLALKHRSDKTQHSRLILFCGSPMNVEAKPLKKLATDLRKAGVAVDVISMGENEQNDEVLQEFVNKVAGESSRFLSVEAHKDVCDALRNANMLYDVDSGLGGLGGGGGDMGGSGMDVEGLSGAGGGMQFEEFGGFNPNLDPEMAAAMQESIREAQQRAEAEATQASLDEANNNSNSNSNNNTDTEGSNNDTMDVEDKADAGQSTTTTTTSTSGGNEAEDDDEEDDEEEDDEDDENEAMQRALQMSLAGGASNSHSGNNDEDEEEEEDDEDDEEFMADMLGSLPGVDKSDPRFSKMLEDVKKSNKKKDGDESKE